MFNLDLVNKGNKISTNRGDEIKNLTIFNVGSPMIAGVIDNQLHVWNEHGQVVDMVCTQSSYMQLTVVPIINLLGKDLYKGDEIYIKTSDGCYKKGFVVKGLSVLEDTVGVREYDANYPYWRVKPENLFWEKPKNKIKAWRWIAVNEHYENIYISKKFYKSEEEAIADLGVPNVEKILLTETEIEVD
jgi:hypothetical protein